MASGEDLFRVHADSPVHNQAANYLAQIYRVLGPPDPKLIILKSQIAANWSVPARNAIGELCDDAESYFRGPFFDSQSGTQFEHRINNTHADLLSGEFLYADMSEDRNSEDRSSLLAAATFIDEPERSRFVDFTRAMLAWGPDQRWTAGELATSQWLLDVKS